MKYIRGKRQKVLKKIGGGAGKDALISQLHAKMPI